MSGTQHAVVARLTPQGERQDEIEREQRMAHGRTSLKKKKKGQNEKKEKKGNGKGENQTYLKCSNTSHTHTNQLFSLDSSLVNKIYLILKA